MRRIIALGDSTVHGYSGDGGAAITTETWPYRLMVRLGETSPTLDYSDIFINTYDDNDGGNNDANTLIGTEYTMLNSGVNGDDTVRLLSGRGAALARFQADVLDRSPDVVVICIGTNDLGIMGGVGEFSASNTAARILGMADSIVAIGARPILCKIPAWGTASLSWVTALNNAVAAGATSRGLYCVDLFSVLCNANGTKKTGMGLADGIHFSATGNQAVADAFTLSEFAADEPVEPTHAFDVRLLADPAPTPTHAFDVRLLADPVGGLVRIADLRSAPVPTLQPSPRQTVSVAGTHHTASVHAIRQTASIR